MKLSSAATHFDKELVYDAYSGSFLFKCQFSSFDDHSSSGATARRRVLSVAPGTALPARKAVTILGSTWVGGNGESDGFMGSSIRSNFNLKRSTGLLDILTPGQACLADAGTSAHAHMQHYKETVDTQTSSAYSNFWNIFFTLNEGVTQGAFIRFGSTFYRVRVQYLTEDGFTLAESDELPVGCRKAVVFSTQGAYNVLTDSYPTVSISTYGIATERPKFYRLADEETEYEKPGDLTLFVAKSAVTPTVASTLAMDSKNWRVLNVVDELDSWSLHVRRI